ncbi:ligase-associated DNA damage response endonuclease PdeM [Camelimonas fluminis]|uniref:Ligase-associated DNA damage response endonuclease PdeM n=1 Tax=Camelimonas fluminis TaxID=1576911 RepID=A0ABV7UJR8_9HYPH
MSEKEPPTADAPVIAAPAGDVGAAFVRLGATLFLADPSGVLFEPQARLLVVADLHLEKGSAFAARGVLLPPWDTRATLRRLAAVIDRLQPRTVIALGDSFHDVGGPSRLDPQDRALLAGLRQGRDWLWVTGNHDPDIPPELGGASADVFRHGGVTFRHAPEVALAEADGVELCGHLHPVARLRVRGRSLRRRCFALGGRRCILPAFGAYAGGLNVRDVAFAPLFPNGLAVRILGEQRVFAAHASLLLPD